MSRLALTSLVLACVATVSCSSSAGQATPPAKHRNAFLVVAVDISASRRPSQLKESQDFVASLAQAFKSGDTLALLRVYERGLGDSGFLWSYGIPAPAEPGHASASDSLDLEDADHALRAEIPVLFDPKIEGTLQGTDLFATLYRVGDLARAHPALKTTLFLVSDMLQSSPDVNMERHVPDASWVEQKAASHLLPNLNGVCIVAIGPDISDTRGQHVLQFWRAYFAAAGADFREDNYRNWSPSAVGLGCP